MVAGQLIEMNLPLQPLDGVVFEGEQLRVVLDQGHADHFPGVPFEPVELHHGAGVGALHLKTVTPKAEDFFEVGGTG